VIRRPVRWALAWMLASVALASTSQATEKTGERRSAKGSADAQHSVGDPPVTPAGGGKGVVLARSVLGSGAALVAGGAFRLIGTVGQPFVHPHVTAGPDPVTNRVCSGWWCVEVGYLVAAPEPGTPTMIEFGLPSPNPSSGDMRLAFTLPQASRVAADLIDVTGRRVRTLANVDFEAGRHALVWNGQDSDGHVTPAGVYFLRIRVNGNEVVRRQIVVVR